MSWKLVPVTLLLFIAVAVGVNTPLRSANADVSGPLVPSATSIESGASPINIVIPLNNTNPTDNVTVSIFGLDGNANMEGLLLVTGCVPGCVDAGESTTSDITTIVVDEDDQDQIVLALSLTCTANGTVTITATTGNGDAQSTFIGCTVSEPTPGEQASDGLVALTASPNLLPCGGGTSVLRASKIDELGNEVPSDAVFHFETDVGLLDQTSGDNTAKLTLGPNQTRATVTAKIFDPTSRGNFLSDSVVVSLDCNDFETVVVTASPNVVDCTGTTTLTATVRDENGHVVEGVGYHWVTNTGLLEVKPNNASNEAGTATLYLRPGDGDATVIVSVGTATGTYEESDSVEGNFDEAETGFVTVQQRCLSTTTGLIKLNSSQKDIVCGETVFIGLSVIDEDIQTVVDETPMTLIATHGGFYGGEDTLLTAAQVPTSHGEANTIYTAPTNYNGEVRITAASGDAYGYVTLNVSGCGVTAPNTGSGTGSIAPCTPIGDGVCITAPNTGRNAITPPSTGTAGLK